MGTSDTEPKQAAVVFSLCKVEDLGLLEAVKQHIESFFGTVTIAVKGFGRIGKLAKRLYLGLGKRQPLELFLKYGES